jgi:DNA polymerase-3 subunit delta'
MPIKGHEKIIATLDFAVEKKNVSHAYLFCGPESVGKFLTAMYFCGKLTGEISGKLNRNLLIIEPEVEEKDGIFREKEIKIEKIKNIEKEFSLTSFENGYRTVIIRSAQKMNIAAQNALLKTLEEPPSKSVLVLVTENENSLLPTIVSRCQIVRFGLLSDEEIAEIFTDEKDREALVFWSLGRPGFAQKFLIKSDELQKRKEVLKEFRSLFSMSLNEKFFFAEQASKDIFELSQKMDLWIVILRKTMLGEKLLIDIFPNKGLDLIEKISDTKKILNTTNANARLAMENLLISFLKK